MKGQPRFNLKKKGGKRGEDHPKAKLDWDKVKIIRNNKGKVSLIALAARFGVSERAIRFVRDHITWKEQTA